MGVLISRFRSKKSTIEILEDIDKDINRLQKNRKENQERQKKIVTSLLIYSIAAYVLGAIIFFVYYFPDTWKLRFLYSLPLLAFPVLIWGLKKLLHWYFVKRIASNDGALLKLREQKKQILEDVMETETYKKAKEILEKFDPVRFRKLETLPEPGSSPPNTTGTPGTAIHQRPVAARAVRPLIRTPQQMMPQVARTPMSTPSRMPLPQPRPRPAPTPVTSTPYPGTTPARPPRYPPSQPSSASQPASAARQQQQQQQQQALMGSTPNMPRAFAMPPGPPMPRTILPQTRGTMDRLMDYLVGDGPENRYALICSQCHSHNGMALKEEFEYLTFRCCYCYYINPARKQRPMAPRLEFFAPRGRNFNTDSQASEDESDDEDENSDEEGGGGGTSRPSTGSNSKSSSAGDKPKPAPGKSAGGDKDGGAGGSTHSSSAAGNISSNALAYKPSQSLNQQQSQAGSQKILQSREAARPGGKSNDGAAITRVADSAKTSLPVKKPPTHPPQTMQGVKHNNVESPQGDVEASDGCTGSNQISVASASPDGGGEVDIPFADEEDTQRSSLHHGSRRPESEDGTEEDISSFVLVNTENQTEISVLEKDIDSSMSTSATTANEGEEEHVETSFETRNEQAVEEDGGETEGLTLSGEIRDSVKSLLSPTAAADDVRDGGSTETSGVAEYNNGAVAVNGNNEEHAGAPTISRSQE